MLTLRACLYWGKYLRGNKSQTTKIRVCRDEFERGNEGKIIQSYEEDEGMRRLSSYFGGA